MTKKTKQKMAVQFGSSSRLADGDPDQKEYGNAAIPRLLGEGWRIVRETPTSAPFTGAPAVLVVLEK